jgi:hypothetical protein
VEVGVKSILHFIELTPRTISNAKQSLAVNSFIPKPFQGIVNARSI